MANRRNLAAITLFTYEMSGGNLEIGKISSLFTWILPVVLQTGLDVNSCCYKWSSLNCLAVSLWTIMRMNIQQPQISIEKSERAFLSCTRGGFDVMVAGGQSVFSHLKAKYSHMIFSWQYKFVGPTFFS